MSSTTDGGHHYPINARHDRALPRSGAVEAAGPNGRVLISIFRGKPYALPLQLPMVERHPLGSQAFMPLSPQPFLVVVCHDERGRPGRAARLRHRSRARASTIARNLGTAC